MKNSKAACTDALEFIQQLVSIFKTCFNDTLRADYQSNSRFLYDNRFYITLFVYNSYDDSLDQ